MVYELKPPVGASPGLLVFTHKERRFFLDAPPVVESRLRRLRDRYVVGMQWGRYHEGVGETPFVDFHLACPGTVRFREDAEVRRIPMCSRDFTPPRFRPMDVPKRWDVLAVGHPIRDKRMSELLDVVRMTLDSGVDLSVLLICAIPDSPDRLGGYWDTEFFEKYRREFSREERTEIHLAAPVEAEFGDRPLHPIPNEVFPYLYNASRGFALFSREEGQSKVIHEALLCGTPVVVHEALRGGGRDYLDERNSVQFGSLEEARDAFAELAEDGEAHAFDPSYLRPKLAADRTAPKLENEIESVYEELGHEYRGEMEKTDLAFKLGGHTLTLRPELRSGNTNDLPSRRALVTYVDELLGGYPPVLDRVRATRADLRSTGVTGVAGPLLRRVERGTGVPVADAAGRLYGLVR
jgi:glycosyltransferase involved in cell wall biosynthesis